jgi:5S rRNA maturation endonuclease (ribonuclease M5)
MTTEKIKAMHQTCPQCGHHECFTEFEDGNGFCHSVCGGYVNITGSASSKPRESGVEKKLTYELRPYRGLSLDTVTKMGILTGVDESGNEYSRVYPYPHKPKTRVLPKDFSQNIGFTNDHLFGMDQYNAGSSKVLTIVEGEDDRGAVMEMLKGDWPVVSLPSATMSRAFLKNTKEWIDSFASIVIATDNDDAGDRAAVVLETTFPNKCYRVSMTKYKDAMEYLENDSAKDFVYAWVNRQKFVKPFDTNTPTQFIKMLDDSVDAHYLPTGIEGLDEIALGLFQGMMTVFSAPEGIGKTEFMRMLEFNLIRNHPDVPFAYCHLEEPKQRSLLGLVSYELEKNVTRKDLITDRAEVDAAINRLMGRETVHQFSIGADEDPDVLCERIKYYANVCGCKYIFFEPIQDLGAQRRSGQSLVEFLDRLSINLSRTAAETGCGIVVIAHMNDDGQIRDCRQIGKQAAVRIDLSRDMEATSPEERNKTRLFVRKNRPVGPLGAAGELMFDLDSFTLREVDYA